MSVGLADLLRRLDADWPRRTVQQHRAEGLVDQVVEESAAGIAAPRPMLASGRACLPGR